MYHLTLQSCIYADSVTLVVLSPIIYTAEFIINVLNSFNVCSRVILPGRSSPVSSTNMKYEICGQNITCFNIGSNVGPGCYCELGYRLNIITGQCVPLSSCPPVVGQSGTNQLQVLDLGECNNEPVCYLIYYYHCRSINVSFQFI